MVGADCEHLGFHRLFHGVDDVRRDRYPDQKNAGPQCHPIRLVNGDACADRFAGAGAIGYLDRPLWWSHRHGLVDVGHSSCDLVDVVRHGVLAVSCDWVVCRIGRRFFLCGNTLCGALVP